MPTQQIGRSRIKQIFTVLISLFSGIFITIVKYEYPNFRQPKPTLSYASNVVGPMQDPARPDAYIHSIALENTGKTVLQDLEISFVFPSPMCSFPSDTFKLYDYMPSTKPKYLFTDTCYTRKRNRISLKIRIMNPHDRYETMVIDNCSYEAEIYARAPGLNLKADSTVAFDKEIKFNGRL